MAKSLFNPFPKYLQIRDMLIRRMGDEYRPGDQLPTEHALCEEFGVSRETVREAMLGLEKQGLIRRQRGQGTFLIRIPDRPPEPRYTGLVEDFTELGFETKSTVLESAPALPPRSISAALRLPSDEILHRIMRLRYLDSDAFALHYCFMPLDIADQLADFDLSHTTLFEEISKLLGRPLKEDYQRIEAAAADTVASRHLNIAIGAPVLVIRRVFGVESKGPPLYFESHFRSDRYFYSVQLRQSPARREATQSPAWKTNKVRKGERTNHTRRSASMARGAGK